MERNAVRWDGIQRCGRYWNEQEEMEQGAEWTGIKLNAVGINGGGDVTRKDMEES